MLKKWFARLVVGTALALGAGCANCRETPEFESQSISTRGTVRLDIALSDDSTVKMLVGTPKDEADVQPPGKPGQAQSAMMSLVAHAPAQVTFSDSGDLGGSPAPLVSSGFIYIVRPPAWPMVYTPSTRGGPPVSEAWNGLGYVAAWVEGSVHRICFLGAFDANGNSLASTARIKVDDFPIHPSNPPDVFLHVGEYAEAQLVGSTLQIVRGQHPVTDPNCPADVRSLLIQIRDYAEQNGLPWNPAMNIPVPGSS